MCFQENGAAFEAGGLEVGQLILEVDGQKVEGRDFSEHEYYRSELICLSYYIQFNCCRPNTHRLVNTYVGVTLCMSHVTSISFVVT